MAEVDRDRTAAIQEAYDAVAHSWEQSLPKATQARLMYCDRAMLSWIGSAERVLELGIGTGRLLRKFQVQQRFGLDLSHEMCRQAKASGLKNVIKADQTHAPLSDSSCDGIISAYGAARYSNPELLANEIARLLKDGGRFAMHQFAERTVQLRTLLRTRNWQASCQPANDGHHNFDSWFQVSRRLVKAGLSVDRTRQFRSLKFPPYYVPLWPKPFKDVASQVVILGSRIPRRDAARHRAVLSALDSEGRCEIVASGSSMRPTFDVGDRLIIEPLESPKRGDVALFWTRASWIVHRIHAMFGGLDGWVMHKGDDPAAHPSIAPRWTIFGRLAAVDAQGRKPVSD